jgi:hypothetical protein
LSGASVALALLTLVGGSPGYTQGPGEVLEDLVEEEIEELVEDQVEEQIEAEVEAQVEQQVEAQVEASVESQVEASVESQVEASVESQVEASVESQVEVSVETQVEAGVARSIEVQIEAGIGDTIEVAIDVDSDLIETLDDTLEAGIGSAANAGGNEQQSSQRFQAAVDVNGRNIEAEVWVVLVPAEFAERIAAWGFTIREQRELNALDRVLLRVDAPEDRDIAQAALELALDAPGTVVDYNHVYGISDDAAVVDAGPAPVAATAPAARSGKAIGIIDSWLDATHPSLGGVAVVQQDFVPFGNDRTTAHGTAVASIMLGTSANPGASPRFDQLYAASVFFKDDEGGIRATSDGLLSALDWLAAADGVDVINMSLAGPPNALLEIVLDELAGQGLVIVAAVGNNGPTGPPLYPAAYDSVVGVTAVDSVQRIYRYANRGRQVMFAAPGVQVRVAAPAGTYAVKSGTSLAAPFVAALVAESIAARQWSAAEALHSLTATAVDLGEPHFDEIFGYGLVGRID